jgi:transcription elongation factor Elf1
MTDKRIKMDCPFCHTPPEQIQICIISKKEHYGQIYCPICGCTFSGQGKQNLIDKWNRR